MVRLVKENKEFEIELEESGLEEEVELETDEDEVKVELETKEGSKDLGVELEEEYGGEDGRPYSDYETVGTKEVVRGDNGVLRIYHVKEDEEVEEEVKVSDYQDRLMEYTEKVKGEGVFLGVEGDPIEPRDSEGHHQLTMLLIEKLVFLGSEDDRLRKSNLELMSLETSISEIGQIEPILVVPLGHPVGYDKDEDGNDIKELPIYAKYQVVHGRRRVEAMANLGYETIVAIVDTTIPREILEFYQASATVVKDLTFSEKMAYIQKMRVSQPEMSPDLLETSVGFRTGELPKAEFIESHSAEYSDVYIQVEKERLTIDQGFKKIDKEITKKQKEEEKAAQEGLDGSDGQDVEDALREKQDQGDISQVDNKINQQELGKRSILDTAIRRSVEARDGSQCQVCGYAHGVPERADNLKAHHMVAVQYGGSDSLDNLIMLCNNCHEEVHKYESGRQVYYQDTFNKSDEVKRIVVLGNILRKARVEAIKYIRNHDSNIGKQMDRGKVTVGQALKKVNVNLGIEDTFPDNSPYKEYKRATADLGFGGGLKGELAEVWEFDEETEILAEPDENLEEPEVEEDVDLEELEEHHKDSDRVEDILKDSDEENKEAKEESIGDMEDISLEDIVNKG